MNLIGEDLGEQPELVKCPNCGSYEVHFSGEHYCVDCGYEFNIPE